MSQPKMLHEERNSFGSIYMLKVGYWVLKYNICFFKRKIMCMVTHFAIQQHNFFDAKENFLRFFGEGELKCRGR